jgi:hypothetical protein
MVRLSTLVRDLAAASRGPGPDDGQGRHTGGGVRAVDLVRGPETAATGAQAPTSPAIAPASNPRVGGDALRIASDLHAFLGGVRDLVRSSGAPSWSKLEGIIERVVTSLKESAELFWLANAPTRPPGADDLVVHQARVAILAVRIGLDVGYDPRRAAALGMAGALIDVSLWEASDALFGRLDALSSDETAIYRAHPQRSAALLRLWNAPGDVIETVLQHHEREQGQGFPRQLSGTAIGQDAKIVGLVDAYATRATASVRRPGVRPHEAIRDIVRSKQESFPPALVKALLSEISVFPPGTLVRLNTGEIGQVVAVNRNHPLRPRIDVVADAKGLRPTAPKAIDLSETPFLYITGPVAAAP